MAKNPLFELYEAGTSVWLDYIRRSLMTSGELKRMIEDDAVVGMTSNPTIFEKAIGGSSDYDDTLKSLVDGGRSDEEIMLSLIVEDIQTAADVLKPVYEQTKHKDGYVSIEVLPRVADDTQGTIAMAHVRLTRRRTSAATPWSSATASINAVVVSVRATTVCSTKATAAHAPTTAPMTVKRVLSETWEGGDSLCRAELKARLAPIYTLTRVRQALRVTPPPGRADGARFQALRSGARQ